LIAIGQPVTAAVSIRAYLADARDPESRSLLLSALIEAQQASADLPALLISLNDRIALSGLVRDSRTVRTALAFDFVEASLNNLDDTAPHITPLLQLLHSDALDVQRRVRAARLLMIAADNEVNPILAAEVFATNEGLESHDARSAILRQNTRVFYHSVFGDRAKALTDIVALEGLAVSCECRWTRVTSLMNAQLARRIVARSATSYSQLEQCYEDCRSAGMDGPAFRLSSRIGSNLFDDGFIVEAREWAGVASKLAQHMSLTRLCQDYLTLRIDLDLLDGRIDEAHRLVAQMPHAAPVTASPRLTKELLVYKVRVDQFARGVSPCESELNALTHWHERARATGRHDDHMEVLWVALCARKQADLASQLLKEYLTTSRRELRSPNYLLRQRTCSDPAWAEWTLAS
jgi:hypothetical protein